MKSQDKHCFRCVCPDFFVSFRLKVQHIIVTILSQTALFLCCVALLAELRPGNRGRR